MKIPSFDLSSTGEPLHFLHANGYPPECYRPLLDLFAARYRVFGMLLRPLWPHSRPEEINDWGPFSADLLEFLSAGEAAPLIGVGHSIGAIVTLRAALQDPSRFRALVLYDPVLFPRFTILQWNLARLLALGNVLHPKITGALKRRRLFDDLETVVRGYRRREVFRYMDEAGLRAYVHGMVEASPDGKYRLKYSPEWETRVYYTGIWHDLDLWRSLPDLKIPALIIRGEETDTFLASSAHAVQRANPAIRIVTLEKSTHLLPLERPQEVFDITCSFLKESL